MRRPATTRIPPAVLEAMMPYLTAEWGYPRSAAFSKLSSGALAKDLSLP